MPNAIMMIQPFWSGGTWVFDDERVGLVREPFVSGAPESATFQMRGRAFGCFFPLSRSRDIRPPSPRRAARDVVPLRPSRHGRVAVPCALQVFPGTAADDLCAG